MRCGVLPRLRQPQPLSTASRSIPLTAEASATHTATLLGHSSSTFATEASVAAAALETKRADIFPAATSSLSSPLSLESLVGQNRPNQSGPQTASNSLGFDSLVGQQRDSGMDIVPMGSSQSSFLTGLQFEHTQPAVLLASQRHRELVGEGRAPASSNSSYFDHSQKGANAKLPKETVIAKWLKKLGITLQRPGDLGGAHADEFSSGVLLCRIVQRCELMRGAIPGVAKNPRNTAAALNNVKNAMEYLKRRRNMPIEFLYSAKEVVEGDTDVIVPLLMQIKKAYHG